MSSLTKKKTKAWIIVAGSILVSLILALVGVGVYFKVNKKSKPADTKVNPLSFSVDAWDGKTVNADAFTENFAGRGEKTRTIDSAASFIHFVNEVNAGNSFEGTTIYLNTSINLQGNTINSIGNKENPFKGTFDGGYYSILNATINGNGLFGATENAEIKNVGLYNVKISAVDEIAGGLIGKAVNTNILNCYVRLGEVGGNLVGGLVGEFISNKGEHKIYKSFADTLLSGNATAGLIYKIDTNNLAENEITLEECYHTAINKYGVVDNSSNVDDSIRVINARDGFSGWNYTASFANGGQWCKYDYMPDSDKLDFNYPVQYGFVKVFLKGSNYEGVVITNDGKTIDASNLAEAFDKADDSQEAQINLIVEKVFLDAEAKLKNNTNITINASQDVEIVRSSNSGAVLSADNGSKIVIGNSPMARTINNSTITIDGGIETPENSIEQTGALIVAKDSTVEIGENVVLKNNVNNTVGYGGAILVENPTAKPVIKATIENCFAEHAGGAICVIGKNVPASVGSIKNCSTNGKGGAIAILDSISDPASRKAMNALYPKERSISFMNDHTDVDDDDYLELKGGVDSFENCSAKQGGAVYVGYGDIYCSEGEGFVSVKDFTETTDKSAGRVVFRNNTAEQGGAIYFSAEYGGNVSNAYFECNKALSTDNASGGAIYIAYEYDYFPGTDESVFINNTAIDTDGGTNSWGGAVYADSILSVWDCYFEGNGCSIEEYPDYITHSGGAVAAYGTFDSGMSPEEGTLQWYLEEGSMRFDWTLSTSRSTYINNQATSGGAISAGLMDTHNDKFVENVAVNGGAIHAEDVLSYSTYTGNKASASGGAIKCADFAGHSDFTNNEATTNGGAVWAEHYITDTTKLQTFTGNKAGESGGAIYLNSTEAYGFVDWDDETEQDIYDYFKFSMKGEFENNTAGKNGGALYLNNPLEIVDSTFNSNKANETSGLGGAIYMGADNSNLAPNIDGSTFNGNIAAKGGALYFTKATMFITDSNFIDNRATNGAGGAIFRSGARSLAVEGTTSFLNNSASTDGGAIYIASQNFYLGKSAGRWTGTMAGNTAGGKGGAITLKSSTQLYINGGTIGAATVDDVEYQGNSSKGAGGAIYVDSANVVITMNGGTITGNKSGNETTVSHGAAVYLPYGTFNLNGGTISNNIATGKAGAVSVGSTATFNMAGGTIDGNKSVGAGGAINLSGTINLTGGTISNNTSESNGGGIYIASTAKVTAMEAVEISGNKADNGGGIYITGATIDQIGSSKPDQDSSYSFIYRAYVSNNEVTGNGGGIFIDASATVNTISLVKAENNKAVNGGGIFVQATKTRYTLNLAGTHFGYNSVTGKGGGMYAKGIDINSYIIQGTKNSVTTVNFSNNIISGTSATAFGGGLYVEDANDVTLTQAWIANNTISTTGGKGAGIYLLNVPTLNITYNSRISDNNVSGSGGEGGAIYCATEGAIINISKSWICDNNAHTNGGAIYIANGTLNIRTSGEGSLGTVLAGNTSANGAAIYASESTINLNGAGGTELVHLRESESKTGAIYLTNQSELTMNHINCHDNLAIANSKGSAITAEKRSTITLNSGSIEKNRAKESQKPYGAIYLNTGSTFTMNGGEIKDNASYTAGAVYMNGSQVSGETTYYSTFNMTGGTISGNSSVSHGGVFYMLNGATVNMTGGTIENNVSGNAGGVFCVRNSSFVTIDGGTIRGNSGSTSGVAHIMAGSTLTMNDGLVDGNFAKNRIAGAFNATEGTFILNGGTISNNHIDGGAEQAYGKIGGGVYVTNEGYFEMNGGLITKNYLNLEGEGGRGANVYVQSNGIFTMNGGTISGTTDKLAANEGDGIATAGKTTIKGGTIENCYAEFGSAIYSIGNYDGFITDGQSFYGKLVIDVPQGKTLTIQNNIGDAVHATGYLYTELQEDPYETTEDGYHRGYKDDPNEVSIFYDENKGVYFIDTGNGVYNEDTDTYEDENGNGSYDEGEGFTDALNYAYDEEVDTLITMLSPGFGFVDSNNNGKYDWDSEQSFDIYCSGGVVIGGSGEVKFIGNKSGRAIYADVNLYMYAEASFENFSTTGNGGAIYCRELDMSTDLSISLGAYDELMSFTGNHADGDGGAVYAELEFGSEWHGLNVEFNENSAGQNGGALACGEFYGCDSYDCNYSFIKNRATGKGGAIYTSSVNNDVDLTFALNMAADGFDIYATDSIYIGGYETRTSSIYNPSVVVSSNALIASKEIVLDCAYISIEYAEFDSESVNTFKILDGGYISGNIDSVTVNSDENPQLYVYKENVTHVTKNISNNAIFYQSDERLPLTLVNMPEDCVGNFNDIVEGKNVVVKTIAKPTVSVQDYYYNGQQHTVEPGLDSDYYEVISGTSGTEVGNYELTIKPVEYYRWADQAYATKDEVEAVTATWSISYPELRMEYVYYIKNAGTENEEISYSLYPKYGTDETYDGPQSSTRVTEVYFEDPVGYEIDYWVVEDQPGFLINDLVQPESYFGYGVIVGEGHNYNDIWVVMEPVYAGTFCLPKSYTVTLDHNDGSGNKDTITVDYESYYYELEEYSIEREGYTLDGWYGKNLLNLKDLTLTFPGGNNDFLTINDKNSVTVSKVNPAAWLHASVNITNMLEVGKTYQLSYDCDESTYRGIVMFEYDLNGARTGSGKVLTAKDNHRYELCIYNNCTNNAVTTGETITINYTNIQLEVGSSATAFEPYIGKVVYDWEDENNSTMVEVAQNHTLIAQWIPNKYNVTFDANDGTFADGSLTEKEVTFGSAYGELPVVTREGYSFDGWYAKNLMGDVWYDVDFGDEWDIEGWVKTDYDIREAENVPDGDYTLSVSYWSDFTTKFEIRSYDGLTIYKELVDEDGSGDIVIQFTVPKGKTGVKIYVYPCYEEGVTGSGYPQFHDWQIEVGNEATEYEPSGNGLKISEGSIVNISRNHTLVARYIPESVDFTVHYNGNGANTGEMSDSTFSTGATGQTLAQNAFKRIYAVTFNYPQSNQGDVSYKFLGWNTKADGSGISYENGANVDDWSTETGTEFTLYAQWQATAETLPNPTKTGYNFAGWANSEGVIVGLGGEEFTPTEHIDLFAVWEAIQIAVKLNANGGYHNILTNHDFEDVTTNQNVGWDNALNGTLTPDNWSDYFVEDGSNPEIGYWPHIHNDNGNKVMRFKSNEEFESTGSGMVGRTAGELKQQVELKSNRTYAVSMNVKRLSEAGYITVILGYTSSSSYVTKQCDFVPTANNEWQRITGQYEITTVNGGASIWIVPSSNIDILVDDIFLVDLTESTDKTIDVTYDSKFGELPVPFKDGHTFDGWYTSATGGDQQITSETVVKFTTTQEYFAKWTKNTYNLKVGFTMDGEAISDDQLKSLGISFNLNIDGEPNNAIQSYNKDLDYGVTYQISKITFNTSKFEAAWNGREGILTANTKLIIALSSKEYKLRFGQAEAIDGAERVNTLGYIITTSDGETYKYDDSSDNWEQDDPVVARKSSDGLITITIKAADVTNLHKGHYIQVDLYEYDEYSHMWIKSIGTLEGLEIDGGEITFEWNIDKDYYLEIFMCEFFDITLQSDEGVQSAYMYSAYTEIEGTTLTNSCYASIDEIYATLKDGYELDKVWYDLNHNGVYDEDGDELIASSTYGDIEIDGNEVVAYGGPIFEDYYTIYIETSPKSYALDVVINIDGEKLDLTNEEDLARLKEYNILVNVLLPYDEETTEDDVIYPVGYDSKSKSYKTLPVDENGKFMLPFGTTYALKVLKEETGWLQDSGYEDYTEESENSPWLGRVSLTNFNNFWTMSEKEVVDGWWEDVWDYENDDYLYDENGNIVQEWYEDFIYFYKYYNTRFSMNYDPKDETNEETTNDDINVINLNFESVEFELHVYEWARDWYKYSGDTSSLSFSVVGNATKVDDETYNAKYSSLDSDAVTITVTLTPSANKSVKYDYEMSAFYYIGDFEYGDFEELGYESDGYVWSDNETHTFTYTWNPTRSLDMELKLVEYSYFEIIPTEGVTSATATLDGGNEIVTKCEYVCNDPDYDEYTTIDSLNATVKEGYKFDGWFLVTKTGNELLYTELDWESPGADFCPYDYIVAGNWKVIAQATANKYTVTLDSDGGTGAPAEITVSYNGKYSGLIEPSKPGYEFAGWFGKNLFTHEGVQDGTMSAGIGVHYLIENRAISDFIYLTAGDYTYTVNNDIYAGKVHMFSDEDEAKWIGELMPTTTTTNGVSVSKFTLEQDCYIRNVFLPISSSSITNFNSEMLATCEVMLERGTTSSAYEPYLGSEAITSETDMLIMQDHTLIAKWVPGKYTVHFDANGGEGTMDSIELTTDKVATLPTSMFTKVGYTFAGWNTESDGSGTTYTDMQEVVNIATGDITLYAMWTVKSYKLTVKFKVNDNETLTTSLSGVKFNIKVGSTTSSNLDFYNNNVAYGTKYSITGLSYNGDEYVWANKDALLDAQLIMGAADDEIVIELLEIYEIWLYHASDMYYAAHPVGFVVTFSDTNESFEFVYDDYMDDRLITTRPYSSTPITVTIKAFALTENYGNYSISYSPSFTEQEYEEWLESWDDEMSYEWTPGLNWDENTFQDYLIVVSLIEDYTITITGDEGVEFVGGADQFDNDGEGPRTELSGAYCDNWLNSLYVTVKDGYTFSGWYINGVLNEEVELFWFVDEDENGVCNCWSNELCDENEKPEGALPVYGIIDRYGYLSGILDFDNYYTVDARTTPNQYVVSFDANEGDEITETITVSYGMAYGDLPTPNRTGYSFVGWYLGETRISSASTVTITQDHTLVANWSLDSYTITFEVDESCAGYGEIIGTNEGKLSIPALVEIVVNADKTLTIDGVTITAVPKDTTGANDDGYEYSISSWLNIPADGIVTSDITIKAVFTRVAKEYSISYEGVEDANFATTAPTTYTIESSPVTLVNPTKDGYVFMGWTGTGLTERTMEVIIPTGSFGDRTYTAVWGVVVSVNIVNTKVGNNVVVKVDGVTIENNFNSVLGEDHEIKVEATLVNNKLDNAYQIIKIYFNETQKFKSADVDKITNSFDTGEINGPAEITVEFVDAYKMTVSDSSTITGFEIHEESTSDVVNNGNEYIIPNKPEVVQPEEEKSLIKFTVNKPQGNEIFIGIEIDGNKVSVGSDSADGSIVCNDSDSANGKYEYTIKNKSEIKSLTVTTATVTTVNFTAVQTAGIKGALTLTSKDGFSFNRGLEVGATSIDVYSGQWKVSIEDPSVWSEDVLADLRVIFGEDKVNIVDGEYIVTI